MSHAVKHRSVPQNTLEDTAEIAGDFCQQFSEQLVGELWRYCLGPHHDPRNPENLPYFKELAKNSLDRGDHVRAAGFLSIVWYHESRLDAPTVTQASSPTPSTAPRYRLSKRSDRS